MTEPITNTRTHRVTRTSYRIPHQCKKNKSALPLPRQTTLDFMTWELPVYFPTNRYGIKAGYYERVVDIVPMLRHFKDKPAAILFIADILE